MAQLVARLVRNEKVGGSNPPSSTTDRHPIADVGFLYARVRCCWWLRWCSRRRRARPLCVPVGGGPPARSPHASLRLGVVDLEARPGPATTHRHRGLAPPARTGTAASPAYNAIPAAASARSYVGVEPLFRAADHVEASSHDVRHRGSAPGLAANRRAMTAPSNA